MFLFPLFSWSLYSKRNSVNTHTIIKVPTEMKFLSFPQVSICSAFCQKLQVCSKRSSFLSPLTPPSQPTPLIVSVLREISSISMYTWHVHKFPFLHKIFSNEFVQWSLIHRFCIKYWKTNSTQFISTATEGVKAFEEGMAISRFGGGQCYRMICLWWWAMLWEDIFIIWGN